jgi:hypothetical protein
MWRVILIYIYVYITKDDNARHRFERIATIRPSIGNWISTEDFGHFQRESHKRSLIKGLAGLPLDFRQDS